MTLQIDPHDHRVSEFFGTFLWLPPFCVLLGSSLDGRNSLAKFGLLLLFASLVGLSKPSLPVWLPLLAVLLICYSSMTWSVNPSRTLLGAITLTYYGLIFFIGRTAKLTPSALRWGLRLLIIVSAVIAFDGWHQYLYRYDEYAAYFEAHATSAFFDNPEMTREWIAALSGRVFSRFFALPSQLAGFLLLVLPVNIFLIVAERARWQRIVWGSVLLLNSSVFFLTKSFGAWLTLLGMASIATMWGLCKMRNVSWQTIIKVGGLMAIIGGGGLYGIGLLRGQYLWELAGSNNPLYLRWLNWQTAWRIFQAHPFGGTGLFTFGNMYPQYMQPGANETWYAHNTYLQFGAELGLLGFFGIFELTGVWLARVSRGLTVLSRQRRISQSPADIFQWRCALCCALSGVGFLCHNLIDFDFYVFSLGLLGVAMLAVTLNLCDPSETAQRTRANFWNFPGQVLPLLLVGSLLCVMYVSDVRSGQAEAFKETAVAAISRQQYADAFTAISNALRLKPVHPTYLALRGSIFLYRQQEASAQADFQAALRADPNTPWFHAGLAEAALKQQNVALAYVESRRAAELFPQKQTYQQRAQEIKDVVQQMLQASPSSQR